jgi:SSS family solute:Na+ symporter
MNVTLGKLDIGIVIGYLLLMIVIGFIANKKTKSSEDYYIAGKKLGTFSIAAMWMASWIGGASIIGTSANAYDLGISGGWYVSILALGTFLFGITFTKLIKRIGEKLKSFTYPDFIEARYDKKTKTVVAAGALLSNIGFTASQFVAMAAIMHTMTGWELSLCFLITAVVCTLYTAVGGLFAVTYTTWIQFGLIIVGVILLGVPLSAKAIGGFSQLSTLPAEWFDIGRYGWGTIIALGVSSIFSFYTGMDSYTRCFAAKNEKVARNGALWASLVVLFIAGASTFIGMAAKVALPSLSGGGNSAFIAMAMNYFPIGIQGIVIVGILSAIMSTAVVCILMGAANVTIDIYKGGFKPDAKEKTVMRMSMVVSLIIGAIGYVLATALPNIIDLLLIAFTILAGSMFFPTILGVFWKKGNSKAAFTSIIVSLAVIVVWIICSTANVGGIFNIDALWPGLIVSLTTFVSISLISKSTSIDIEKANKFIDK